MSYVPPGYAPPPGYGQPPMGAPPPKSFAAATEPSEISERTAQIMHQTKGWTTFLAVLGFLGLSFMVLFGIGMFVMTLVSGNWALLGMGALYVLMAALYVYPALKLWGYSKAVGELLISRRVSDLEAALDQQRLFWRFFGIMTIVMIVLYAVGFLITMATGMFLGSIAH